jgi:hypothetical protein
MKRSYSLTNSSLNWKKCIFVGYPRETIGYTFYHLADGKTFVAKTGTFLKKEFLAKGVSGRKVELDEIIGPSLKILSSIIEVVPNAPSIEEEEGAPDENHGELAKQTKRRSTQLHKPLSGLAILYYLSC